MREEIDGGPLSDAVEEVAMAQLNLGFSHKDWALF
jgi:hypothetical protein